MLGCVVVKDERHSVRRLRRPRDDIRTRRLRNRLEVAAAVHIHGYRGIGRELEIAERAIRFVSVFGIRENAVVRAGPLRKVQRRAVHHRHVESAYRLGRIGAVNLHPARRVTVHDIRLVGRICREIANLRVCNPSRGKSHARVAEIKVESVPAAQLVDLQIAFRLVVVGVDHDRERSVGNRHVLHIQVGIGTIHDNGKRLSAEVPHGSGRHSHVVRR